MTLLEAAWVLTLPVGVVLGLALVGGRGGALAVVALGIASFGLAGAAGKAWQQWQISQFEPVEATVVVSERGRRANDWTFAYEYHADGEARQGSRLTHGPRLRGRKDTDHLYEQFPVGARFTAWVDPRDPTRSVVYRRPSYSLAVVAASLHGLLLAAAVAALRRPAAPAAPR